MVKVEWSEDLEDLAPGPELARRLDEVTVSDLTAAERVRMMRAHQKLVSYFQAKLYQDMAVVWEFEQSLELEDDFAAATQEIRATLRLTRRAAEAELSNAIDFWQRLPRVGELLKHGQIDLRRAKVFTDETASLPEHIARLVVEQTSLDAPYLTTGQLRALLHRLCITVDPEHAARTYEDAVIRRRVVAEPNSDGTATLSGFDLPPDRVEAAMNFINRLAKTLAVAGEGRTVDQLRADIMLDLLAGHPHQQASGGKGMVDLHVDLATLAGLSEEPGELGGYGPVIADIARQVANTQTESPWRYVVTDQETGAVVKEGTLRRRPTAHLRRQIERRNPRCVFPGCRMPAAQSDLDHIKPHAEGGKTEPDNFAPGCRHDHLIRHQAGWTYKRLPQGDYLWTSPLGLQYTTSGRPPP